LVHDACDQWGFGSDDGEVGLESFGGAEKIRGREIGGYAGRSWISGGAKDLVAFQSETPGKGVLAASTTDDENFHESCFILPR
jgi:hypothetical protein